MNYCVKCSNAIHLLWPLHCLFPKEFMPFKEIYTAAFKNDIEYSQVILHTTAALQANKFIQVTLLTHPTTPPLHTPTHH